jgi:hypothetical protein
VRRFARVLISVVLLGGLCVVPAVVATAEPDVIVIPPTQFSEDPDEQRLNSMSTLTAFFEAVDGAPHYRPDW